MSTITDAFKRRRVELNAVNADDLLNRLMGRGIAREMPRRQDGIGVIPAALLTA